MKRFINFLFSKNTENKNVVYCILGLKFKVKPKSIYAPQLLSKNIIKKTKYSFKCLGKKYITIAAILKDEPDIIEWIEYHKLIGIEQFYLYDNQSSDNVYEKLKPYIADGTVIYRYVVGDVLQFAVYRDAIYRYQNKSKWIALIDLDEFLVPVEKDQIKDFLVDYENYPAVAISSIEYDCNNIQSRPLHSLLIETFTGISKSCLTNPKLRIKSIVNPKKIRLILNPHGHWYKNKESAVTEQYTPIPEEDLWFMNGAQIKKIRLNHYYTKSIDEYNLKLKKAYSDKPVARSFDSKRLHFEDRIQDYVIFKYLPRLKEKLKNLNYKLK